jgi:prolactin
MVAAVAALPHVPDTLLSRTKELEERIQGLLEGLKIIFNRVRPLTFHLLHGSGDLFTEK